MKKLLAIVMVLMLFVTVFAGCGNSADTSKEVTLKWIIRQNEQKDAKAMQEVINTELAKLLPNTKLEFIWEGNMSSKWSMWMAAKAKYDLAWAGYEFDMLNECKNDAYTDLTDLVDKYAPNIKKEKETFKTAYDSATLDGRLYAIPNEQPILHQSNYLSIGTKYWDYFPLDEFLKECHNNTKTTERVYQLYEQFLLDLTEAGIIKPGSCSIDVQNFFLPLATRGYDWVGVYKSGAWLCYDAFDKDAKIVSFMQTDAYKLFIKYAARWFDMGYISEDYLATGSPSGSNVGSGNTTEMWYSLDDERGVRYVKDTTGEIVRYDILLDDMDNMFVGTNMFGSEKTYTVVPFTSPNPERAVMFLDLLHSEEGNDLLNLIIFGEEGKHYTKKKSKDGDYVAYGEGYIQQPDSGDAYGIPHWMVANVFQCYRTPNILDGQKEWAMDFIKNADKKLYATKYKGFVVDTSNVTYKISQVKTAISEYHDTLICGALSSKSYEAEYNNFMKKMNDAGIQEIIDELQKQADEYVKTK